MRPAVPTGRRSARPDGRGSSAAGPTPSSAAGGSSSCARRRSPTASAGPVVRRPSGRCAPGRPPRKRHSGTRSPASGRAARRSTPSSPSSGCSTASPARSTRHSSRRSSATPRSRASTPCAPPIPPRSPRTSLDSEAFGAASGRRVGLEIPGFDGTGVTVAQLDTGVDLRHPYLQGRLLHGIDILDADGDPSAEQNPTEPGRPERHGTGLAGLVVGVRGPAGLHGVAPGASLLPIRVAGWQPDADGGVSVYGRTDQVLAGLEAAVDPNADGDAHDAARIALVGVVEPFASFADSPLARAGRGALALGTLVVVPGGNDGPAGPGYGSLAGPAGATGALGVAASDSRSERPTVHVLLRAGLARARVRRDGARRRGRAGGRRLGPGRGAAPPAGGGRHEGERARPAVRRRRLQPRGGRRRAPPVRADDARGGRRARVRRRARRPRRRADPRRLARGRRAGPGPGRRRLRGDCGRGAARPRGGGPRRARRRRGRVRARTPTSARWRRSPARASLSTAARGRRSPHRGSGSSRRSPAATRAGRRGTAR